MVTLLYVVVGSKTFQGWWPCARFLTILRSSIARTAKVIMMMIPIMMMIMMMMIRWWHRSWGWQNENWDMCVGRWAHSELNFNILHEKIFQFKEKYDSHYGAKWSEMKCFFVPRINCVQKPFSWEVAAPAKSIFYSEQYPCIEKHSWTWMARRFGDERQNMVEMWK